MWVICIDLESVLFPEIWIKVAEKTKIEKLRLTTREIPDYQKLMAKRIEILKANNIKLKDIQKIIKKIPPLKGAKNFLSWLRKKFQVIILTDSFYEFLTPVIEKFSFPTVFCNSLKIDKEGFIENCQIKENLKAKTVKYLKEIGFKVVAIGDSYNDIKMLEKADVGILFNPSQEVAEKFPQFPKVKNYSQLKLKLNSLFK